MYISQADLADTRRILLASPPRDRRPPDAIDFKVRPISEDWRLVHRMPAYKTATCTPPTSGGTRMYPIGSAPCPPGSQIAAASCEVPVCYCRPTPRCGRPRATGFGRMPTKRLSRPVIRPPSAPGTSWRRFRRRCPRRTGAGCLLASSSASSFVTVLRWPGLFIPCKVRAAIGWYHLTAMPSSPHDTGRRVRQRGSVTRLGSPRRSSRDDWARRGDSGARRPASWRRRVFDGPRCRSCLRSTKRIVGARSACGPEAVLARGSHARSARCPVDF